jgi:hypothetical protein
MNEAVAYKDEVARIGLQRGPSGKAGLPYEYEHDEKSTVEQQPQHQNHWQIINLFNKQARITTKIVIKLLVISV